MQLILVQSEVEQAIKDYVHKLISVNPDTNIEVDLSATRGAEGVKAIIELTQAGTTESPAQKRTRRTKAEMEAVRAEQADNAGNLAEPQTEPSPEQVGEEQETVPAATAETTDEAEAKSEEAEPAKAEEAPANPPRSLFANLKKPVNH